MLDGPATPKQVAYLSYMGIGEASCLTKQEASDKIESLRDLIEFEQFQKLLGNWHFERFILYPDIYSDELNIFLTRELPEFLHRYIRGQVKYSSERVTRSKICKVIDELSEVDDKWWQDSQRSAKFYQRFSESYPKCCDGITHETLPFEPSQSDPLPPVPIDPDFLRPIGSIPAAWLPKPGLDAMLEDWKKLKPAKKPEFKLIHIVILLCIFLFFAFCVWVAIS